MLIIRPTVTGYAAFRDRNRGSWLIECICKVEEIKHHFSRIPIILMILKVFVEKAHEVDLKEMCDEVATEIRQYQTELGYKQSVVRETRGTFKKLYFNPKLHEGNNEVSVVNK